MLARVQQHASSWTAGRDTMAGDANDEDDRARRFRDAALPYLDDAYSFTFTAPGSYEYFCSLHPHMTGTIVVEGP